MLLRASLSKPNRRCLTLCEKVKQATRVELLQERGIRDASELEIFGQLAIDAPARQQAQLDHLDAASRETEIEGTP